MSLNVIDNIIIISVHRCAHMCVHIVFICASTCKCVSIYGGQRELPWVLFFGNNSSHFWFFFRHSYSLVWSLPSRLSWLVSEQPVIHLPPPPQCSEYKHMLSHLGSLFVGCLGFWQGFWRLKSGPHLCKEALSWASCLPGPSLTILYLKHFILSMAIYSWAHPILSYGRSQEGSGPVNT